MMAQAMNETKSTDTDRLIEYFEKETEFDILKARKGHFRAWDHQLMQEAYSFTVTAKGKAKDKRDTLELGAAIPAPHQPLETIALTKEQTRCNMKVRRRHPGAASIPRRRVTAFTGPVA